MKQKEFSKLVHQDLVSLGISTDAVKSNKMVRVVFDNIIHVLSRGQPLEIQGLGVFTSLLVKRRDMSDQENNAFLKKWEIRFKTAGTLKKKLNDR